MGDIVGALLYLRLMSFANALLSRLRRLRQPKYLIGAIIGVAYVYFTFLRRLRYRHSTASGYPNALSVEHLSVVVALAATALTIFAALCWIWPRARASLAFSEAEIAWLFPAPVSRRALIHYRMISMQLGMLFTALVFTVFSGSGTFLAGGVVIRILGWWVILTTITLYLTASSFTITRLLDRGLTSHRRRLITVGIIALAVAVIAVWAGRALHAPRPEDLVDFPAFVTYLASQLSAGPLPWLLLPAKWVIRPIVATDPMQFLMALGPALAVVAANYVWLLRSEASFEDASLARAGKRAAKLAAMRTGKVRIGSAAPKARRPPFDLSRARRPELAFLWKNLLSSAEYLRPRTALIAAACIVIGCQWLSQDESYEAVRSVIAMCALGVAVYLVMLGPMLARQDLRSDLLNADILKTYPLRGWQIVLGEILTPVAILTVLFWLLLMAAALTGESPRTAWLSPPVRTGLTAGIALVMPLLCAIQVLIMNAATLLFPAWMQASQGRAAGIEVMGQRIFFVAGLFIAIAIALLPAVIIAGIGYFIVQLMFEVPVAAVIAGLVVMAVLAVEVILLTFWLGERFERFDLSAELRP